MARGKVGDLVFYVRNGSQQTRVRNREPENPRSQSQMYQRVKLASVVGFYKRQASFFRFALKKSQKESYYNAFVRYNINISPYLTREQAAAGVSVPAPYVIADGNMPRIYVAEASISSLTVLDLTTSIPASIKTWGDMRRSYNLVYGDMLSLIVFNAPDDELDPTQRIVVQHRFDQESDAMPIGYDMVGTEWDTDGERVQISVDAPYFGLVEFFETGSAIVLSRNNGQVDCSYAKLELDAQAMATYLEYRSEAQRDLAARSYGQEKDAILDPKQFEGNYVDMIELYSDSALKNPLTEIVSTPGFETKLYYDAGKWPNIEALTSRVISGADVIASVSLDADGEGTIEARDDTRGSGTALLSFFGSNDKIVANAVINIRVTQA